MKVILLAAGRSFRMQPIADKNFLKFLGKPLIEHQIEALKKASFKDILVIGGAHNIKKLRKLGVAVKEQKDLELGMAGAILTAASWIKNEPFLVVSGNDIFDESAYDIMRKNISGATLNEGALLAYKVKKYFPGGYLKVTPKDVVTKIVEKPGEGREPSKLINIVMHYHPQPKLLFAALQKIATRPSRSSAKQISRPKGATLHDDRYERALQTLFDQKITYRVVPFSGFWQPLKYPWHVLSLMKYYIERIEKIFPKGRIGDRPAQVAKTAVITGTDVYFEDGVKVLDNAVIVGPAYIGKNTVIATGALVRNSHIGAACVIGFGSEIARSYIGDGVWTHTNYIGDSVVGNNVSFGSGTVTGNLRLDEGFIKVSVTKKWNGKTEEARIDTDLTKLGLITGDNIRVGVNTSFMPGVKIGSNSFIGAGITVAQDIPENSFVTGEWTLKVKQNRARISPRKEM